MAAACAALLASRWHHTCTAGCGRARMTTCVGRCSDLEQRPG
jgi:hypothetical protein